MPGRPPSAASVRASVVGVATRSGAGRGNGSTSPRLERRSLRDRGGIRITGRFPHLPLAAWQSRLPSRKRRPSSLLIARFRRLHALDERSLERRRLVIADEVHLRLLGDLVFQADRPVGGVDQERRKPSLSKSCERPIVVVNDLPVLPSSAMYVFVQATGIIGSFFLPSSGLVGRLHALDDLAQHQRLACRRQRQAARRTRRSGPKMSPSLMPFRIGLFSCALGEDAARALRAVAAVMADPGFAEDLLCRSPPLFLVAVVPGVLGVASSPLRLLKACVAVRMPMTGLPDST